MGRKMRITFIIKDIDTADIEKMPAKEAFDTLHKYSYGDLRHYVAIKWGTGNAFRDRVEANQLLRGEYTLTFKIEPRRGYQLATFELGAVK